MNLEEFKRAQLMEDRLRTLDIELKNFERLLLVVGGKRGDDLYFNAYDVSQEKSISGQMSKELAVAVLAYAIRTLNDERSTVKGEFDKLVNSENSVPNFVGPKDQ